MEINRTNTYKIKNNKNNIYFFKKITGYEYWYNNYCIDNNNNNNGNDDEDNIINLASKKIMRICDDDGYKSLFENIQNVKDEIIMIIEGKNNLGYSITNILTGGGTGSGADASDSANANTEGEVKDEAGARVGDTNNQLTMEDKKRKMISFFQFKVDKRKRNRCRKYPNKIRQAMTVFLKKTKQTVYSLLTKIENPINYFLSTDFIKGRYRPRIELDFMKELVFGNNYCNNNNIVMTSPPKELLQPQVLKQPTMMTIGTTIVATKQDNKEENRKREFKNLDKNLYFNNEHYPPIPEPPVSTFPKEFFDCISQLQPQSQSKSQPQSQPHFSTSKNPKAASSSSSSSRIYIAKQDTASDNSIMNKINQKNINKTEHTKNNLSSPHHDILKTETGRPTVITKRINEIYNFHSKAKLNNGRNHMLMNRKLNDTHKGK